jgi:hypothetical protein
MREWGGEARDGAEHEFEVAVRWKLATHGPRLMYLHGRLLVCPVYGGLAPFFGRNNRRCRIKLQRAGMTGAF